MQSIRGVCALARALVKFDLLESVIVPIRIRMSICLMILGKQDHVVDISHIYATFLQIVNNYDDAK